MNTRGGNVGLGASVELLNAPVVSNFGRIMIS
jgi:hypothetical protein